MNDLATPLLFRGASDDVAPAPVAHLIGIGGSGMRSLAAVLLGHGWRVTGSEVDPQAASQLSRLGACIYPGHAARHVPADAELVVYSDAVAPDNVERRHAARQSLTTRSYPEALSDLAQGCVTMAVAGTHGKSTTTAMASAALLRGQFDPVVVCGATPLGAVTGGRPGNVPALLVEACEYRANFLRLNPHLAVVLGVELDHFDYYRSRWQLIDAFWRFAARVREEGLLLVNRDCPIARGLIAGLRCRTASFGFDAGADWSARRLQTRRGRYRFELVQQRRSVARVTLHVPGKHNVLNALAAAALASAAGVDTASIAAALSDFRGVKRRLQVLGSRDGVAFVDDYAHHPTAVRASLAAVRAMYPGRRLWCLFQPHQVSRTAALLEEFAASLQNADKIAVADIDRAREPDRNPGEVTAADLAAAIAVAGGDVLNEHELAAIVRRVKSELRSGDVLITMGAGEIGKIGQAFHKWVRKDRARG